jgi:CubicO group peptidase (beta-lactamase class C family)
MVERPLSLRTTVFAPGLSQTGLKLPPVAPTEDGFRVGGPLDYGGAPALGPVSLGVPHDDNANYLMGAAGHAGLFSCAEDLFKIMEGFERARQGLRPELKAEVMDEFLRPQKARDGSLRPLGFDILQLNNGSLVGHLGYTGTTLWWSP